MQAKDVQFELSKAASAEKAKLLQRFFKTGPGQYVEGDVFRGIVVPDQRIIAKKFIGLDIAEIKTLLQSKYHEDRFTALLILMLKYKKGTEAEKKQIYNLYLASTDRINNWDLVDVTAGNIVGNFLREHGDAKILYKLAKSKSLWERRIAIISTGYFIINNEFDHTLKIAEMLLGDKEDLMHKATGWMLREVGKRDQAVEESFLKKHCRVMPRTMLRYAIEKFPEPKRMAYLSGEAGL